MQAMILSALSGCVFPFGGIDKDIKPWDGGGVLLNVSPVRQGGPNLCGLAAAEMLEGFYGLKFSSVTAAFLVSESKGGLSGRDLNDAFQGAGYYSGVFSGTLDHGITGLYRYLDRGWPVIVMLGDPGTTAHYVVLIGYDRDYKNLAWIDPERGPRVAATSEFQIAWTLSRNFSLLAVPKDVTSKGKL